MTERQRQFRKTLVTVTVALTTYVITGFITWLTAGDPAVRAFTAIQSGMSVVVSCLLGMFAWQLYDEITTARDRVLTEVGAHQRATIAEVRKSVSILRDHVEIQDQDLRTILEKLREELHELIGEASNHRKVTLKLDDLFWVVRDMMRSARYIRAVDIDVNRWEEDVRAIEYFKVNRAALARGALIQRVYVVSPHVDFPALLRTIANHGALNEDSEVQQHRGRLELRAIYCDDVPPTCRHQDFAIFGQSDDQEGAKVLLEQFNDEWRSTYRGYFVKREEDVRKYEHVFDAIWARASHVDTEWRERTHARIEHLRLA